MTRRVSWLLLLALLLGACAPGVKPERRPQMISAQSASRLQQREWTLRELSVHGRQIVIDVDTRIVIRFGADGNVAGVAAVNRFSGGYRLGNDAKLSWAGGFTTTRMAGPPELMEKERAFLDALPKVSLAVVAEHTLMLQSDDGAVKLTFTEAGF